jgi:hypothetical protein
VPVRSPNLRSAIFREDPNRMPPSPGIPEADRELIWERFARLDDDRRRQGPRAGHGQGPDRRAWRQRLGRQQATRPGATFLVRLPVSSARSSCWEPGSGRWPGQAPLAVPEINHSTERPVALRRTRGRTGGDHFGRGWKSGGSDAKIAPMGPAVRVGDAGAPAAVSGGASAVPASVPLCSREATSVSRTVGSTVEDQAKSR